MSFNPPEGGQILVKIGDGGDPEVFASDCLINTEKGIDFSSDASDFVVPDCANPTAPGFKQSLIDGLLAAINGGGKMYTPSVKNWFAWFKSGAAKNIRYEIVVPGADGGGYFEMKAKLTSFSISAQHKQVSEVNVSLSSDGEINWVDAV